MVYCCWQKKERLVTALEKPRGNSGSEETKTRRDSSLRYDFEVSECWRDCDRDPGRHTLLIVWEHLDVPTVEQRLGKRY